MKKIKRKLVIGMICYAVLILLALLVLLPVRNSNETFLLVGVLLFFALLIIKTVVHSADDM